MTQKEDMPLKSEPKPKPALENSRAVVSDSGNIQSAFKKMAEQKPEKIMEVMAMGMSSVGNPLHSKMTSEHVSQILELTAKQDERQYDLHKQFQVNDLSENKSNRAYAFAVFVVVMILIGTVLFLFKNKPEILLPVLTGIGGLITGGLGGWGLGKRGE
ncbi:MAG: hypothetical protein K8S55_06360 [Phycisphaerae bacterium]|nr:hypothetical protein [Phycisphaerae bacterium]